MSNEYTLGTPERIVYARAVTRRPFEERWNAETIANLRFTPWERHVPRGPRVSFEESVERHEPPVKEGVALPKKMKVTKDQFKKYIFYYYWFARFW